MLKVKVTCHINEGIGISTRDVWLERYIEIPFPPIPGLYVKDKDWEDQINEVYYDAETHLYEAWVPSDKEIYHRVLHNREGLPEKEREKIMLEKVKDALEIGWVIQDAPDYIKESFKCI